MTCGSGCSCTCSGTVRSRRCDCCNSVKNISLDKTMCGDNGMFINQGQFQEPYLDPTESYGSGLSQNGLQQLRVYESNARRIINRQTQKYLRNAATTRGDSSRGIAPMSRLEAANAIRFGNCVSIL